MLRFSGLLRSIPLLAAAAALACGGENLDVPTTGSVQVTTATSGADPDPDGYTVTLDGSDRGTVSVSGTRTVEGLSAGDHLVGLSDLAGNCQIQGDNPRTSSVAAGATATAAFVITCTPLQANTGSLRITAATSGSNPDPDGYTVAVDGGATQPIPSDAPLTISGIVAGSHTVTLGDVATNCSVVGVNPMTITVVAGQTASANFTVACSVPAASGIAFISDQGAGSDVYIVNPAGGGLRNLTNGATGSADNPQWSPDRSKIVFEGGDVGGDLYVINADGTGLLNLTDTPPLEGLETSPVWSPDGTTIAFAKAVSLDPDGDTYATNVYTIRPDRSQLTQLTTSNQESPNGGLSWSPDGSRIAFTSERGTSSQIYVMGSNGSGQTLITTGGTSFGPQWSPAGTRIAFIRIEGGPTEVWAMNPDGGSPTPLTTEQQGDLKDRPTWSPDGGKIAYMFQSSAGSSDIWTMNADGGGKLNVTNNRQDNTWPVWSPDGNQIAFVFGFGSGSPEVRVVNADGSGVQRNVSTRQGYRPDW